MKTLSVEDLAEINHNAMRAAAMAVDVEAYPRTYAAVVAANVLVLAQQAREESKK